MKRLPVIFLLLFLVACGGNGNVSPTVAPTAATLPDAAASRPTPTAIPVTSTTLPPAIATVADTSTDVPATVTLEVTPDQPTATTVLINGKNEDGTFFRGRADAPITFIDYSDFL